jgi:hypothetical protein
MKICFRALPAAGSLFGKKKKQAGYGLLTVVTLL